MKTFENMEVIPLSDPECLTIEGGSWTWTWFELEMWAPVIWGEVKAAFAQGITAGYNAFHLKP